MLKNAKGATDVVYKIQYGAGAVFSFQKEVKENECVEDIEGNAEFIFLIHVKFLADNYTKANKKSKEASLLCSHKNLQKFCKCMKE